ncbi:MAG: dTDP-4-dehydrorhamnose 3,5-epimerase [Lentisphaerota bacterium]
MAFKWEPMKIPDVLLITPQVFGDARGFFMETYQENAFRDMGIRRNFVQDNFSHSCRGTLRGLHYQLPHAQAKLVSVIKGEVLDVAVDIRRGSPTFGQWVAQELSDKNRYMMFIPEGFAHGFCVLSEEADFMYKCTDFYSPKDDHGVLWSDPALAIPWPAKDAILSPKDLKHPVLSSVPAEHLPAYS